TVLVHGLGDIGSHFAKKIQALGGHVIAVKRTVYGDEEFADEVYAETDLDKVLPRADIIASSVPGTHETYKLFNQEKFDLMKENAIFLNVGRGTNVGLEALCDALESKKIAGAGIDVTDPEPLPKGHRAWHTERLLITPHASGGYTLPETWRRFMKILEKNLDAYANGKELTNIVDMKTGYKRNAHK
ncbi:MAG: D-2-hydroxyacid dehydrogenase, partial [Lactococcus lactis]